MKTLSISTQRRIQLIDITEKIHTLIQEERWERGAVIIFVPHTTAGVTINEGADPDVRRDIEQTLSRLIPYQGSYRHAEGNSDAHIKTTLTGSSVMIIIDNGNLRLGTWQAIFFCEYDGPRTRKIWVEHLPLT